MLARQDGGRPRLSNERYRVREACRGAEERYGLRRTAPGDRTAARRPTRVENEKTRRNGRAETPRVTLRRAVSTAAAGASSEAEFFARLADARVLVRQRRSTRNPGEITGYAVALPGDTARGGGPVWFGGGKLAADLTWPKLRSRWEPARTQPGGPFTSQERNAIWEHAGRTAADASAHIRSLAGTSPGSAADAAWATADTLHAAAAALGSRVLRQAADSYDRAARPAYGRTPRPTSTGDRLRQTARLLAKAAAVSGDHMAQLTLITQLAALAEAVISLRYAQRHAAQAAAARRAAEHLHAAARDHRPPAPARRTRPSAYAGRTRLDFPLPLRLDSRLPTAPDTSPATRPGPRSPRRPRGPTR